MLHPADRCPHHRPFAEGFRGCPAYQPAHFVPLDTGYRPLGTIWTCGNLEPAPVPVQQYRRYPRCRIGDAVARDAWVFGQDSDRLAELRALSDELNPLLTDHVAALWAAKAEQLRADTEAAQLEATARMRALGDDFLGIVREFLVERDDRMAALGFPVKPTMTLFANLVENWVVQSSAEVPVIPDEDLEPFPPEARAFFKPGSELPPAT